MRQFIFLVVIFQSVFPGRAQDNIYFSNPAILPVLKGDYDPQEFMPANMTTDPRVIAGNIYDTVSPDSLMFRLEALNAFDTRNTGSDTTAGASGIGAARAYILAQFESISERRGNRLITGFLQFDQEICGMGRHKNVVAVLPGRQTADPSILLIEAHMDSRCDTPCDVACVAKGMEDNGSGTALVMELARVMSQYAFDHTIVFMATTAEEQGLLGANAFAEYAVQQDIQIRAVLNNDIVGGIICGETASPPGCPGKDLIDSTQVRMFSFGGFNSPSKALCRYIKLQYEELLKPQVAVPMQLTIMSAEDRLGRGGDHIPFRQRGFPAMRFTSAHEHGDASHTEDYADRQHTSDDVLGVDTDGDGTIDSFYVDKRYLARNTIINGVAAAAAASSPASPRILSAFSTGEMFDIQIDDPNDYGEYVIGLRTHFNDFDTLYYLSGTKDGLFQIKKKELNIFLSVASIDSNGTESLFSDELLVQLSGTQEPSKEPQEVMLFQNKPNPFDESTILSFWVENPARYSEGYFEIRDAQGQPIKRIPVRVSNGINEVLYHHGYHMAGAYFYSLWLDGRLIGTKRMIFAY